MTKREKYLWVVGKYLPPKIRAEILDELRSHFETQLELGEDEDAILEAMGNPMEVARSYHHNLNYLIAPELRSVYFKMLGLTLAAVTLGLFVAHLVDFIFNDAPWHRFVLGFVGGIWVAWLCVFGSVTLMFFLINRYAHDQRPFTAESGNTWSPEALDKIHLKSDEFNLSDIVVTLIFSLLGIVFLDGYLIHREIMSIDMEAVRSSAVWITAVWGFQALLMIRLLCRRRWTGWDRLAKMLLSIAGTVVVLLLINGEGFITAEGYAALEALSSALVTMVRWIPRFVTVMAVIGLFSEAAGHLRAHLR